MELRITQDLLTLPNSPDVTHSKFWMDYWCYQRLPHQSPPPAVDIVRYNYTASGHAPAYICTYSCHINGLVRINMCKL